jgi:CRISPR-associated protein Csd1
LIVPGNAKPSGSGINPGFLWDNPAYLLGYKADDKKPKRTLESFEALRKRHLAAEAEIDATHFSAVCRFLERWDPNQIAQHERVLATLEEIAPGFGVFQIRNTRQYVHQLPAVLDWWRTQLNQNDSQEENHVGTCLVTGQRAPIAQLHEPKIKGVRGGQSAGALLVSFNDSAYESFGQKQGGNAPVSEVAAFQYCTALNRLLADGSRQRIQIGDATTVFWTDQPTPGESMIAQLFDPPRDAEDEALKNKLQTMLAMIAAGKYPAEFGPEDTPFYMLGLSPNAARVSIRFWHVSTLGEVMKHLGRHFDDLAIDRGPRDSMYPSVYWILRETVREAKDMPPLLSGALMRAILGGTPYPHMLFTSAIRRIRADRKVPYLRAAILKACLNRNSRFEIHRLEKELGMSLDPDRPEAAYHLGRLFAALEKAQEDAFRNESGHVTINATVKDRYFSAASATPASVFPRLIRLNQHHLSKLKPGARTNNNKRIQAITERLEEFPPHLRLYDQGLFAIGYYHQRQDFFKKKDTQETDEQTITADAN